jgi:hypothetical protein
VTSGANRAVRLLDGLLLAEFVALTFLLGCFLDQDADIWWHLRAGRDLWASGQIPRTDPYLFAVQGAEWIDLHWGFQAVAAWLFDRFGFASLTMAAAVAAAVAMTIALGCTARRRSVVAIVWCWLPALFVMSARFYPRPEMVSLIGLAAVLAVLHAAHQRPALLWMLVPIQLVWINAHSLFVLGWVLIGCWLIDRALSGAMRRTEPGWQHRWLAPVAVVMAAFVNPYTWKGVLFPLTLFRRMSTEADFYGRHIGELMSIPAVIAQTGVGSVYVRLSLVLLAASAASFALRRERFPFLYYRVLAFGLFAGLGLLAVRNQPQFALVAGMVLAWNVGDWLAARPERSVIEEAVSRIVTSAVLVGLMLWVATGGFYAYAAEGRRVGLGEHPLWFAHDAAKFAARDGMPRHLVAYHEGQAAVQEFHMRPDQRVFVDPRLEVSPREALTEYYALAVAMGVRQPTWPEQLARLPQPLSVVVDHASHHLVESALIGDSRWRCVWFDAVAGVYVPRAEVQLAQYEVDFAAKYFAPAETTREGGSAAETARSLERIKYAESLFQVGQGLLAPESSSRSLGRVLMLASAAHVRDLLAALPDSPRLTQLLASTSLALYPQPPSDTSAGDVPLELLLGLSRGRYFLNRALQHAPADFQVALTLVGVAQALGDPDALWVAGSRLAGLRARTAAEFQVQREVRLLLQRLLIARAAEMPALPPVTAAEVLTSARTLATQRRFGRARDMIEGYVRDLAPESEVPWELVDLRAMLALVAGDPAAARQMWSTLRVPAEQQAILERRIATSYFIEADLARAVASYGASLARDPSQSSTRFGLAVSHLELANAAGFVAECRLAVAGSDLPTPLADFCREMSEAASPHVTDAPR